MTLLNLQEYVHRLYPDYVSICKKVEVLSYKDYPLLKEKVNLFLDNNQAVMQANRCHLISMELAKFDEEISYVEGYSSTRWLDTSIRIPMQHGWSKWQGRYFDLTAELIYRHSFDEYLMLTEGTLAEIEANVKHPLKRDESFFGYHTLSRLKLK